MRMDKEKERETNNEKIEKENEKSGSITMR
jgi:hypothetical protein